MLYRERDQHRVAKRTDARVDLLAVAGGEVGAGSRENNGSGVGVGLVEWHVGLERPQKVQARGALSLVAQDDVGSVCDIREVVIKSLVPLYVDRLPGKEDFTASLRGEMQTM